MPNALIEIKYLASMRYVLVRTCEVIQSSRDVYLVATSI